MAALDYLKARGLNARQNGNKLRVSPKEVLTPEDRQYICLHRMEILAELSANDGEERRLHWRISLSGEPACIIAGGPMSKAEALLAARHHWPQADVEE